MLPEGAYRKVRAHAAARTLAFQRTHVWEALVSEGAWVDARIVPSEEWRSLHTSQTLEADPNPGELHLWHPRVWFSSFPTEWTPAQLFDAGCFVLHLQRRLLAEGWELKDATPYNLLLEGTRWIHVDHLSPQSLEEGGRMWQAFGQFHRTFFLPLLLHQSLRLPTTWIFNAHRDGIHPEEAERLLGLRAWTGWQAFQHVKVASLLGSSRVGSWLGEMAPKPERELRLRMLDHLERDFLTLEPKGVPASSWTSYDGQCPSYAPEDITIKRTTIDAWLNKLRPSSLLDLGCNTGTFSLAAARNGARVVAVDADAPAVSACWLSAKKVGADIQPLVVNIGAPTPSTGWENREFPGFLDRCREKFQMVTGLALLHHLLVERIPLDALLERMANYTNRWAILEFIHPQDPMFSRVASTNIELYSHLDQSVFETALAVRFLILERVPLKNGLRCLYLLQTTSA